MTDKMPAEIWVDALMEKEIRDNFNVSRAELTCAMQLFSLAQRDLAEADAAAAPWIRLRADRECVYAHVRTAALEFQCD